MKLFDKIKDKYLAYPIFIDIIVVAFVWCISKYSPIFIIQLENKENQINLLSNLIGTNVSLAGFILAALTIIVAFKSNVDSKINIEKTRNKQVDVYDNALELIFSSKHYNTIVKVFQKALLELILCFIVLFFLWLLVENLSIWIIYRVNLSCVLITSFTIIRSLSVLFLILKLDNQKNKT